MVPAAELLLRRIQDAIVPHAVLRPRAAQAPFAAVRAQGPRGGVSKHAPPGVTRLGAAAAVPIAAGLGLDGGPVVVVVGGGEGVQRLRCLQVALAQRANNMPVAPLVDAGLVEHMEAGKEGQLGPFHVRSVRGRGGTARTGKSERGGTGM